MNAQAEQRHLNSHGTSPLAPWAPSAPNGPEDQDLSGVEQSREEGGRCSLSVSVNRAVKRIGGNTVHERLRQAVPGGNLFVRAHPRTGGVKDCRGKSGESLGHVVIPVGAERETWLRNPAPEPGYLA